MSALRDHKSLVEQHETITEEPEFFLLNCKNAIWKFIVPMFTLLIVWILMSGVING